MLTARCPNNPKHKRFRTVAHVMQEWLVDEHGEWEETTDDCLEVSSDPDPGNYWTCEECGAYAKFDECEASPVPFAKAKKAKAKKAKAKKATRRG